MSEVVPTVLVVEDSRNDAFLLQRALKVAGAACAVQVVRTGREALDYLSGRGAFADRTQYPMPRLLFLDLTLPLITGFEVLTWLNDHPSARIPVVVMTASSDERDKRHALQMGVKAYLPKPPNGEVIRGILQRVGLVEPNAAPGGPYGMTPLPSSQ
ncbi:MAG TPA: response regulator [Verrucomicrobiae bacterium]|nr:response regulator [Verrucomicrobiae bacterium]